MEEKHGTESGMVEVLEGLVWAGKENARLTEQEEGQWVEQERQGGKGDSDTLHAEGKNDEQGGHVRARQEQGLDSMNSHVDKGDGLMDSQEIVLDSLDFW